ncbi:MAG: tyrosine-protein phosphatase [Gaiellaceae bacterium]
MKSLRSRELVWDGCINVRDLGGLPTEDGRTTRFKGVVRSDSVRQLTEEGWQALAGYGVRRIVDLRWHDELAEDPRRDLDIEVVHVPVFPDLGDPAWEEAGAGGDRGREYAWLLETGADRFAQAVTSVSEAPEGPVVVHCAAGKDRTGLVAALVLRLVGVPHEAIVDDYVISGRNLEHLIGPWVEEAPDDKERKRRIYLGMTPPAAIEHAVVEAERRHGSVHEYLRSGGASHETLTRLQEQLVD